MAKYVFCDLDYTLLDNNKDVSVGNLEAIKAFEEKGNHFVICTGRVSFAIKKYKDLLNAKNLILSNGAMIISNDKEIKKRLLSKETMARITNYALDNNINIRYFSDDHMILLNKEVASKRGYMYKERIDVDRNNVFEHINGASITKLVISSDDKQILEKAEKDLKDMNLEVELSYSTPVFLEVTVLNQNKGNGVKEYCEYNSIDIKDTISIGDNDNDLSMLTVTGYSACPSNATDDVKKIVDYICTNDNNNSAIKEVLEKIS